MKEKIIWKYGKESRDDLVERWMEDMQKYFETNKSTNKIVFERNGLEIVYFKEEVETYFLIEKEMRNPYGDVLWHKNDSPKEKAELFMAILKYFRMLGKLSAKKEIMDEIEKI